MRQTGARGGFVVGSGDHPTGMCNWHTVAANAALGHGVASDLSRDPSAEPKPT